MSGIVNNMVQKNLIVFFIPPDEIVNGGVMSIFSMCSESRKFKDVHQSDCAISVYPGLKSYRRNKLFKNDEYVYEFDELLNRYPNAESILLHIPEFAINEIFPLLTKYDTEKLGIKINVLNQNIKMMPTVDSFANLFTLTEKVTQTTAHQQYSSQDISSLYATPLTHLSVFIDPKQYNKIHFSKKQNIILYSPDGHVHKDIILKEISSKLPNYQLLEINNLTYQDYKKLISKAKFVITFGEGLDGYLIESVFSKTISFAVYNDDFFPDMFNQYNGIYDSYDDMLKNIVGDIKKVVNEDDYLNFQLSLYEKLVEIYSYKYYVSKIKKFYKGEYDFFPTEVDRFVLFTKSITEKNNLINSWINANELKDRRVNELEKSNQDYKKLFETKQNEI